MKSEKEQCTEKMLNEIHFVTQSDFMFVLIRKNDLHKSIIPTKKKTHTHKTKKLKCRRRH